jgi:tetratricopeptide (TPR) repeat protein
LEETGIAGAALAAAFLIGISLLIFKLVKRRGSSSSVAAFGLAFGLIAVAIHSASDFGQRVPAIMCLTATTCGLLVAIAFQKRNRRSPRNESMFASHGTRGLDRGMGIASLVGVVGIWSWALYGAYWAFLGEQWWAAAFHFESRIQQDLAKATDEDFANLIAAAEGAFEAQPKNVNYGYWLSTYRWESLSRATDSETGEVTLHTDVVPFISRIADELAAVRRLCPTYGPPYALEGQLRLFVLNDPRGADLIRTGVRLASFDAPTCLVAGELAAREGNVEEAQRLLNRAVALQPAYFSEVIGIYLHGLSRPDLARALAGDEYWRLDILAGASAEIPELAQFSESVRREAVASLRRRASSSDATPAELVELARIEMADQRPDEAREYYRQALSQEYGQVEWRIELARALMAAGKFSEALREVEICLRLRPQHPTAEPLRAELSEKIEKQDPVSKP